MGAIIYPAFFPDPWTRPGTAMHTLKSLFHTTKMVSGMISGRVLTGPQSVQLSLVDSCNYRCIMCWEHSSEFEGWGADELARRYHADKSNKSTSMNFDIYRDFVTSLSRTGTRKLSFAGIGEPLLHRHVAEAVAFAKSKGMTMWVTTNGSRLDRELMAALVKAGLDDLCVSINAGSSADYALVHKNQEPARFDEIIQNLSWLNEYKKKNALDHPRITLSNVISRMNSERVIDMMESGIRVGAAKVSYRPLGAFPLTEKFMLDEAGLRTVRNSFSQVRELGERHGIQTDIEDFDNLLALRRNSALMSPCFAGWLFPFVLANGDVTFCCLSREVVGNLGDSSFESIWYSARRKRLNDLATRIHRTQEALPNSRCHGCEQMLANQRIYRRLWPVWGRPRFDQRTP
ncbi:MAG TPA: radical SAM/SPASM domain-containing protein [Actinobacteria bacterium]|nr:radical SAM/SPASM domain-containing protein [Actinomycetota bacterium]